MAPGTPADKETLRGAAPAPAIVGLSSVNQSILKVILRFLSPWRVMSTAPFQSRWRRRKGGERWRAEVPDPTHPSFIGLNVL